MCALGLHSEQQMGQRWQHMLLTTAAQWHQQKPVPIAA